MSEEFVKNEEVKESEEMTSMADALDSVEEINLGDTVMGDVLAFDDNQVRVAIQNSGGLEGVVPRNELSSTPFEELTDIVNIGDEIELVVLKPIQDKENGNYLLSKRRVETRKIWNEIQEKAENNETITAPVTDVVRGGLVVDAGVRGFVPASMVEDYFVEDFSPYKGQTLEFKIIEIEPSENRLILSHKEISAENRRKEREARMAELEEDTIIEGKVARLTNFGAFIDLDGVDGLVHISRIAHEHVVKPSDYLTIGETIEVKILSVDQERGRVSLSIKDTLPGPWDDIEEKAPVDSVLDGVVKRLTSFGAFVEVFPGVEGLVHISQIAHEHIATPHDRLEEGQEVKVKVLKVDPEAQRLSLSIKALLDRPAYEQEDEDNKRRGGGRRKERSQRPRRQNRPQASNQEQEPEGGFSLADMLGDQLSDLKLDE